MKRFRLPRLKLKQRGSSTAPKTGSQLRFIVGATLVLAVFFWLGLYLFFPAQALKSRIEHELRANTPAELEIDDLKLRFPLGLLGTRMKVHAELPQKKSLEIDRLSLTPLWRSLFSSDPGMNFEARLYGGALKGELRRQGGVNAKGNNISFAAGLAEGSSLAVAGVLSDGRFSGAYPLRNDTQTLLDLSITGAQLTGVDAMGAAAPALSLGTITLQGTGKGPSLKISKLTASGGDLETSGTGTLLLTEPVVNSRINLSLSLTPGAGFDPALADLLGLVAKAGRDGSYRLRLTGTLASPRLR